MKIVTPDKPVFITGGAGVMCYRPFCRYVVSEFEAMMMLNNTRSTHWDVSSFNPYERRYGGQDVNGKKICMYRHTAYGDQLMISAVPRYIKTKYPDATIHLYCEMGVVDMWDRSPWVEGSAIPIPIPFDIIRSYDYHIFYEGMLENNGEPDQNCCYDDFFGMVGLTDVPDSFKSPNIVVLPGDYQSVDKLGIDLGGRYMVYHWSPANLNRCYPPDRSAAFINMFLSEHRDWRVFIVGRVDGDSRVGDVLSEVSTHPGVVNLVNATMSFRWLIPIVEKASVVVCPDSSILHLTACFPKVPMVSLWGLFSPCDRSRYYINDHPLFKPEMCSFAPCHNHDFTLPLDKCVKSVGWVDGFEYCNVLAGITPVEILEKVEEVIQ